MADVSSGVQSVLPGIIGGATSAVNIFAWIIIAVIILAIIAVITIFIVLRLQYKNTIKIFEKIDGRWMHTKTDKAKEIKFSGAGDTIFYLRKHKKYLPNPKKQSGPREYWFHIREDDEWINFELADLDEEAKKMGASFLQKEARFARTQIQKGLAERYDKESFMQKYGVMIFSLMYIVVMGVMIWLAFDKFLDITQVQASTSTNVLEKSAEIITKLDNICTGGQGFVPA